MSQSQARATRRFCKRKGHWPKSAEGRFWCANCGVEVDCAGRPVNGPSPAVLPEKQ